MRNATFIFSGQGSQYIGMGKDFYDEFKESRYVLEESSDDLSMDLRKLCFDGSGEELRKTENTQSSILATSIAMIKVVENEGIDCEYTVGLSLGEYTSIVLSGGFDFSDAIKIVQKRGGFMQSAVPLGVGGMVAILGLNQQKLSIVMESVREEDIVEVANYNSPEQIVISGELNGLKSASKKALELGAKKVVELPLSAPFHSSLLFKALNISDLESFDRTMKILQGGV